MEVMEVLKAGPDFLTGRSNAELKSKHDMLITSEIRFARNSYYPDQCPTDKVPSLSGTLNKFHPIATNLLR